MPYASVIWVPMLVRMDVHSFNMQFINATCLELDGLYGSVLLGLYMSFVALMHNFLGV